MNSNTFWEEIHLYRRTWARHAIHWLGVPLEEKEERDGVRLEFGPYRFPPSAVVHEIFDRMPRDQMRMMYVTHEALMYRFPYSHPDRQKRGEQNGQFLNAQQLCANLVPLLESLNRQSGIVVLRIAPVFHTETIKCEEFIGRLGRFLDSLPPGYRYGVESGNEEYLSLDYLRCLRDRGVMPVLNGGEGWLPLSEQVMRSGVFASQGLLVRGAIGEGRMVEMRDGILTAVRHAVAEHSPLYVHLEVSGTWQDGRSARRIGLFLLAVMRKLDVDLAKLSPIKRRAA